MNYTIHRLDLGEIDVDSSMRARGVPAGETVATPVYAYLIVGGEKPILVDAGYRNEEVALRCGLTARSTEAQSFDAQLAKHGLTPADLGCVLMTHLHMDHTGHLHRIPHDVPIVVNRTEMAYACAGVTGHGNVREDMHDLLDRNYVPDAMRLLDLELSGPVAILPGITCQFTGGHTIGSMSILVQTAEGIANICGDIIYDVEAALLTRPASLFAGEPTLSNNFTVTQLEEGAAIKRAVQYRFVIPAHEDAAVCEAGEVVGRVHGDVVPGPITPVDARLARAAALARSSTVV